MIRTVGLTKHYGALAALVDLNLHIREGEIFGFIGPNGAGKTTTMRILATLMDPTAGKAFIANRDVSRQGKEVRRLVGYMPDFMGVYDDLKVFEYLEFFAAAFSIPRRRRKGIVDGVLELTDLTGKRAARVDSLSRGMQQRLQLARVLIHDPKVLILDEPASGLDPRARIEIRELLCELKTMGKTIMISSHILSELEQMCDRVGIIESGRLVFNGTREEIDRRMGVHCKLRIRILGDADTQDKAVELLSTVPEIESAQCLEDHISVQLKEIVELANLDAPAPILNGMIAKTLVNAGFSLVELTPERIKLDDAFLQLTQGLVH